MRAIQTDINGVVILEPITHGDERGYFFESWRCDEFEELTGSKTNFIQENQSRSCRGVVRGLHFQKPPHSQAKLVRVVEGCVLDIAVDLRRDSVTYGQHVAVELSAENRRQLFIPQGFAHGFAVLSDYATFIYKCDNYYAPASEGGIRWDDPALGIDWKISRDNVILSAKDLTHPLLADFDSPFNL